MDYFLQLQCFRDFTISFSFIWFSNSRLHYSYISYQMFGIQFQKKMLLLNSIPNLNLIPNVKNISIRFPNKFNFTIEKTVYTAYVSM